MSRILHIHVHVLSYNTGTSSVPECVHSTSVGADATFVFLLQVIEELDDASGEFLPPAAEPQPLPHDHELELGTLLSAASLVRGCNAALAIDGVWQAADGGCVQTIRYVTERQAMTPLLQRYRDAFDKVLQFPGWTHKCHLGLKAVALMGTTRVLESFGDQVPPGDVLKQLRWLFPLFRDGAALRLNTLLRPACEYVAVALQTHPSAREAIFTEVGIVVAGGWGSVGLTPRLAAVLQVLPLLLGLLTDEGAEMQETAVAEAVKVELATTVAVLLEAKAPHTSPNTFALLALPSFVEEMEADESKVSSSNAMFTTSAEAKSDRLETLDEEEEKPSTMALARQQEEECCKVLCTWLDVDSRRMVAAQALATMYRVIANGTPAENVVNGAMSLTTPLHEMAKAYHSAERRSAKGACSAIRHTLVEAFLSWLHHPDAVNLLTCQVDFLHNVAGTLADPRVYGDVLAVLRASPVPEASLEYETGRRLAVVTICQAINQLARYSKSTANRIISGLTRVAAACRCDIHPLANDLVQPLLPSMLDGSQWGKFLRLRTEAVATVLIGCAENDNFQVCVCCTFSGIEANALCLLQVENYPWISDFISFLLDPVVSSENVHSFMILCGLIRAERKLLLHVVSFCMANPQTVTQTLHEPLARWPLYEEDVELVVVTLELLEALLSVNTLRCSVDVDVIYATILQLSENAASEGLEVISTVCKQVMASLGSKQ
ncbi:unnamed protein product [Phytophthora fragariaefolia]|uniref:Unnamed protein product n=1 Tax=Phytophthora fragariaefolia TaxID=1490495 RepID=A0A9W7D3L1_9STRA|nr:unnamed protein product [Phytophthora fragariaefolia]